MTRVALIQGASGGIGLALATRLLLSGQDSEQESGEEWKVFATCRAGTSPGLEELGERVRERLQILPLDLEEPASIERAAARIEAPVDLLINASGVLHDEQLSPEKRIESLESEALLKSFAVNAIGPALVARAFFPHLRASKGAVLANLSARVGSIGDNRLGGWYGYRASKAALNQLTRTLAIEFQRRARDVIVVALHPGTVETALSKPFPGGTPKEDRFSPERAARQLLGVIEGLSADDSGRFFAWDGSEIVW
jgi:NAD(P)-dependent dehydrogenase (short-subunit alcohol dehydrogenase family)